MVGVAKIEQPTCVIPLVFSTQEIPKKILRPKIELRSKPIALQKLTKS